MACQERELTGCPRSPRGPCGPMGPGSPWKEEKYSGEWKRSDTEASEQTFQNIPAKLHCSHIRENRIKGIPLPPFSYLWGISILWILNTYHQMQPDYRQKPFLSGYYQIILKLYFLGTEILWIFSRLESWERLFSLGRLQSCLHLLWGVPFGLPYILLCRVPFPAHQLPVTQRGANEKPLLQVPWQWHISCSEHCSAAAAGSHVSCSLPGLCYVTALDTSHARGTVCTIFLSSEQQQLIP